jgi:PPOX class probable FMN-dependent enzyme
MKTTDPYGITTVEQLRARIGEPHPLIPHKLWPALEPAAIEFIKRSPFLLLATADTAGNMDVSPKGDGPGFVVAENETTLLIPDRKGNKLIFGLQNILANPHVGLIFLIPGTDETLRVNGTAELTADPATLERLSARGQPALVAIRVTVRECFFHCAKAFMRSQLWHPESWSQRYRISFGKMFASKLGGGEAMAQQIDQSVEEDYKNNL